MASALAFLNRGIRRFDGVDVHHHVPGVKGILLDTVAGGAASYGIGQAYVRYHDKWWGRNAAKIAAGVGKLGAVALSMLTNVSPLAIGVVESVGQAGVNAYALDMGIRHARRATGKKAVLVPATTDVSKIAGAEEVTAIGAGGRSLNYDQIAALASMS